MQEKMAMHILQFYFQSLFSSFSYPCGYFLRRGVLAYTLNGVFGKDLAYCMLLDLQFFSQVVIERGKTEHSW